MPEDRKPQHLVQVLADLLCDLGLVHLSESRFLIYKMRKIIPTPRDVSVPTLKNKLCN